MAGNDKWRNRGKAFRTEGIAFAIPMVLVTFPVVGGIVGKYLAGRFEQPWLLLVCVLIGLAAGIRECIRLVRLLNRASND